MTYSGPGLFLDNLLARPQDANQQQLKSVRKAGVDLYGDSLPQAARRRLGTLRWRHAESISFVAFSRDGAHLVSGGEDSTIRLWEASTGKEIQHFQGVNSSFSQGWLSPDGKTVISISRDDTVQFWDVATGKELRRIEQTPRASGCQFALSSDGKILAAIGSDSESEPKSAEWLFFWDVATGKEIRRIKTPFFGGTSCMAFSPDGTKLALGRGLSLIIALLDARTGKSLIWFSGHRQVIRGRRDRSNIESVIFSADGKFLVSGATDQTVRLWNIATGKQTLCLEGHQGSVRTVAISPDGKTIASGSKDQTIRLWSATTGKELHRLGGNQGPVHLVRFSPDGKILAAACADHMVHRWTVDDGKELVPFVGHGETISAVAYSRDGLNVVTVGEHLSCFLWDLETGRGRLQFSGETDDMVVSALSPTGSVLAVGDRSGGISLREVAGGAPRGLAGHRGAIRSLAVSRDGKTLASAGADCLIYLWDVTTGRQLSPTLNGEIDHQRLCFSPDGKTLASRGLDGTVLLLDIASGKQIFRLALEEEDWAIGLAFSPDGKTLVSGSYHNYIDLWELASGRKRLRFKVLNGYVRCSHLLFSPDGNFLIYAGWDNVVHLWDVATGKEFRQLAGHQGLISCLALSPDGKTLASGSRDTTALIWDLTSLRSGDSVRKANLTPSDLERLWKDLGNGETAKAFGAFQKMVQAPEQSLVLLKKQVHPVPPVDTQRIGRLIAQLDAKEFEKRDDAEQELAKLSELAEPQLRRVLADHPSVELRRRAERLLAKLEGPLTRPEQLQAIRVVEVLEHIGSAEARALLTTLAQGAPQARLTREAQHALERLNRLPPR